ncbi:MAG: mannose-1-phosphate guanylyltransferase [Coprobacillus sp.]
MLCALIMAGGRGTRFWPISTEDKPKQFLNLIEDRTMLQLTFDRCLEIMNIENIFICTSQKYVYIVKEQLPLLPVENIILEPVGRNTAPCVLLSTLYIKQVFNDTNIVVLPSDHKINNLIEYFKILKNADNYLTLNKDGIITLGIKPTYPETGYGYIKYERSNETINVVDCFVEKPDVETAEEYINQRCYLWNAGMFIFQADYMISIAEQFMLDTYHKLIELPVITSNGYYASLCEVYPTCESISFDYAIAEKCELMMVIESDIDWDDVGSWKALERYLKEDKNRNISKGEQLFINCCNNVAYTKKKVIMKDVENVLCVESDDYIIITKKENIETIHMLKEKT